MLPMVGNADAGDGESLHGEKWDANIAIAKIAGCMHASPTRPSRRRFTRDLIFFFFFFRGYVKDAQGARAVSPSVRRLDVAWELRRRESDMI